MILYKVDFITENGYNLGRYIMPFPPFDGDVFSIETEEDKTQKFIVIGRTYRPPPTSDGEWWTPTNFGDVVKFPMIAIVREHI